MTPEQLFQAVSSAMLKSPPTGLNRQYIRAFLERNRAGMLAVIRQKFDQMCRPGVLIAGYEQKVGFAVLPPEVSNQQSIFVQDIGKNPTVWLSVKARCHPMDPVRARQYAVHSRRADEKSWRIHHGEDWHPSEREAITAFALAHAHEARWLVKDSDESWSGVKDAPYVLAETLAVQIAKERLEELEEARMRDERISTKQQENYRQMMAERATRSAPPAQPVESPTTTPSIQAGAALPTQRPAVSSDEPVVTLWDGRRGAPIPDDQVKQGMRCVTTRGEHGKVEKVDIAVWTIAGISSWGAQTTEKRQEKSYTFYVRLDSGRLDTQSKLYEEQARPRAVIPDVALQDGGELVSPSDAWRSVLRPYRNIDFLLRKANDARKPINRAQYSEQAEEQRKIFKRLFSRFHTWRSQNPAAVIEDFDPLQFRILTLEAGIGSPGSDTELRWLKATPKDWPTRFAVGDGVVRPTFSSGGLDRETRDRIVELEGIEATLESDGARVPLYLLRSAPDAPVALPTYSTGMWLADLGKSLLVDSYMGRAPAATAIKAYLADQGIDVRTRVDTGANMNGVTLTPPGDAWALEDVSRMNELLHLDARRDEARIHPTATEGAASDWQSDYAGRPSGVWLDPDRIPEFAPYLAKALKDAGQSLNRVGEAWLARSSRSVPATLATGPTRNGATAEQRAAAAQGCTDISFQMPQYGQIRVVCGARGRRDSWNNLYIGSTRYGSNGGRWARGMVPPVEVLEEVRRRGVTTFDSGTERLEESNDDLQLDPVIAEILELGGLRADLIADIGEEMRPKARAIPGFLRPDGKDWLALAQAHYNEPGVVVVEELPADWWSQSDISYETVSGYIELTHFGLDYSYPDVRDEHYEDGELVERLCSCQRPAAPLRRAG